MSGSNTDTDNDKLDVLEATKVREGLSSFATGVCIVTTLSDEGVPVGLTINSFSSVSLDPPIVLWSLVMNSPSRSAFTQSGAFVVNVIGEDDLDLAMSFARPIKDKFSDVKWRAGYRGMPVIEKAITTFECSVMQIISGGDHEIYLGKIVNINSSDKPPLIFQRSKFSKLGSQILRN